MGRAGEKGKRNAPQERQRDDGNKKEIKKSLYLTFKEENRFLKRFTLTCYPKQKKLHLE